MLFDAHTHLNYEEFSEEERLDRAKEIEESLMWSLSLMSEIQ